MKKTLAVFLFYFFSAGLNSQTVTQAFNEPTVGDVDKNYSLDTSAYTTGLPSAVTGSNVVWDFTKVQGAFPVIFDSIVTPSAAPGASIYPDATYAQKRGGINAFFKSNSSPSQTEWLGVYTKSLSVTFTNSAIIANYPLSYGYSSTDDVVGTFTLSPYKGVCNGTLTIVADGIGTLNLPNNVTFQNVLRLRSVEELTMTTGFITAGTIRQSVFSYYAPGKKYPVISVQYQKYETIVGTPTITAVAYGNFNYFTVAGVNETTIAEKTKAYPNPFHDQLFLKAEPGENPPGFRLYNLQGQLLRETDSITEIPDIEQSPGIYILEIREKSGSIFQKIVKE